MTTASLPVVFAADNNYAIPLLVSAYSLMASANEGTAYQVVVLVPSDFDEGYRKALCAMARDFSMPEPDFRDMGSAYANMQMQIEHTSLQTYYRLMIPDLFDYDTCLYLDVDVVVRHDLSGLFDVLAEDELLAGVKAAGYYWPPESLAQKAQTLMVDAFDQYVNAGVLVMNVRRMRELGISKRFAELIYEDFKSQDQDIMNSACYGSIRILPPAYNAMTIYRNDSMASYDSGKYPYLSVCYTREEWLRACEDPVIVHYANKFKPWSTLGISYASLWWKTLEQVDAYYPCREEAVRKLFASELALSEEAGSGNFQLSRELEKLRKDRSEAYAAIERFSKDMSARVELHLTSETKPRIRVTGVSDKRAYTIEPSWLKDNQSGFLAQSYCGELEMDATCEDAGQLSILLRSIDDKDAAGKRVNHWVEYSELSINGENVLVAPVQASYTRPVTHKLDVEPHTTLHIRAAWNIYSLEADLKRERVATSRHRATIKAKTNEIAKLEKRVSELQEELAKQRELVKAGQKKLDALRREAEGPQKGGATSANPLRKLWGRVRKNG